MARVFTSTFTARKTPEGKRSRQRIEFIGGPEDAANGDGPRPVLKAGCGDYVEKGEKYYLFAVGFRGAKQTRCTKHYPKPSELDGSIFSEVLAAQEDANASLSMLDTSSDPDDLRTEVDAIIENVRDAVESVKDQYATAAEAMGGEYGGGAQFAEWRDSLDSANVLQWTAGDYSDEPETCDDHDETTEGCEACAEKLSEWADGLLDEARSQIDDISKE